MHAAQDTLKPKSKEYDENEIASEMIKNFEKLNVDAKRRHIEQLQAIVNCKEDVDFKTVEEKLFEDQLAEVGFTRELQEKMADMFFDAVAERVQHDPFRQELANLLEQYSPSPFLTDEGLDVVQALANRAIELQNQIACVENQSEQLRRELHQNALQEAINKPEQKVRRSTVNEMMLEVDPDNEHALFNETHPHYSAQMQAYLRAMGDDLD